MMNSRARLPWHPNIGPHRVELVDAKHGPRKVEVVVEGCEIVRRWGREDDPPRVQVRHYPSVAATLRAATLGLNRLRGRGYVETPRNLELEAEIARSPDDASGYQVYADWLCERGDPLGEFIAVATALDEQPDNQALRDREQQLLAAHPLRLADPRWSTKGLRYRFGFVEGLVVDSLMHETEFQPGKARRLTRRSWPGPHWNPIIEQLSGIRRHPCGATVRRVYTLRHSYLARHDNGDWLLERL